MKPFIIAEVGSNWNHVNGDKFDACIEHIRVAKLSGADAVKFQLFTADTLYSEERMSRAHAVARLNELNRDWIPYLSQYAGDIGIELWASVFSESLLQSCHGLDCVKIASGDFTNTKLVNKAKNFADKLGKKFCISTGGASSCEIGDVMNNLSIGDNTIVMHAVSLYPASGYSLAMQDSIDNLFEYTDNVGYSDHTTSTMSAVIATALGVSYIEHHFMIDECKDSSPDYGVSFNHHDMYRYCDDIAEAAVMSRGHMMSYKELAEVKYMRRGIDGLRPMDGVHE